MFIQVDHESDQSCFDAVCDFLRDIHPGEFKTITGMAMGERVIHADVVRALIHTARDIGVHRNFRSDLVPDGRGWGNVLLVTCTGFA